MNMVFTVEELNQGPILFNRVDTWDARRARAKVGAGTFINKLKENISWDTLAEYSMRGAKVDQLIEHFSTINPKSFGDGKTPASRLVCLNYIYTQADLQQVSAGDNQGLISLIKSDTAPVVFEGAQPFDNYPEIPSELDTTGVGREVDSSQVQSDIYIRFMHEFLPRRNTANRGPPGPGNSYTVLQSHCAIPSIEFYGNLNRGFNADIFDMNAPVGEHREECINTFNTAYSNLRESKSRVISPSILLGASWRYGQSNAIKTVDTHYRSIFKKMVEATVRIGNTATRNSFMRNINTPLVASTLIESEALMSKNLQITAYRNNAVHPIADDDFGLPTLDTLQGAIELCDLMSTGDTRLIFSNDMLHKARHCKGVLVKRYDSVLSGAGLDINPISSRLFNLGCRAV